MNITFLLGRYPRRPSGGALVVYEYANRLAKRGHKVTVAHSLRLPNWQRLDKPSWARRFRGEVGTWVEALTKPSPKWIDIDSRVRILHLANYQEQSIPDGDVVVATFWPTVEPVMSLPPSKGVPFYLIQHYENWAGDSEAVDASWLQPIHKIVVADWLKTVGLNLGVNSHDITHIPNSLDHETFRLRTSIANRRRRVAMLYSETPWKGAANGISAIQAAKERFPELEASIYGVWPRPDGLPDWMDYEKGPRRERIAEEILPKCSLFLCPSLTEGWGLPGAEAMAAGCALVSTANDGVDDYAVHNETALLSPPNDVGSLAANLISLLEDESRRIAIAGAGEKSIRSFDWTTAVDSMEYLFHRLGSNSTAPIASASSSSARLAQLPLS
jgi:glycosyltransferase involved in cell wall biosynthesis